MPIESPDPSREAYSQSARRRHVACETETPIRSCRVSKQRSRSRLPGSYDRQLGDCEVSFGHAC
jgi:hypothetical protein